MRLVSAIHAPDATLTILECLDLPSRAPPMAAPQLDDAESGVCRAGDTVLVIYGLVITEVVAVWSGALEAWRMLPTWCLQAGLLALFAGGYHYHWLERRVEA
jgi:hypothetical protein